MRCVDRRRIATKSAESSGKIGQLLRDQNYVCIKCPIFREQCLIQLGKARAAEDAYATLMKQEEQDKSQDSWISDLRTHSSERMVIIVGAMMGIGVLETISVTSHAETTDLEALTGIKVLREPTDTETATTTAIETMTETGIGAKAPRDSKKTDTNSEKMSQPDNKTHQ